MVLCSVGIASAAPPKADGAASGPFYDLGTPGVLEGVWTGNTSRFGDEFDISVGTGATAAIGPRWWINWDDCARGGSSIAEVRFAMARTAASTSPLHAFRVTDTGGTVFATSENFRDGLAGAIYPTRRPFAIATSGCRAQLRIDQAIAGNTSDPAKRYWVTSPRAIVRDVQPPSVAMGPLPAGWRSVNALDVAWSAWDNFDQSGVGNHHVFIDGGERFVGAFRQLGDLGASIDLAGIADGQHSVAVVVDGDGTAGGSASGTILLDRTPPNAILAPSRLSPGHFRIDTDGGDPAPGSGLASWNVQTGDGAQLASSQTGTGPLADVNLSRFDGSDVIVELTTRDVAGNQGHGSSAPLRVDVTAPSVAYSNLGADWHTSGPLPVGLDLGDNRADGIGALVMSINRAGDGTGSGEEVVIADVKNPARGPLAISPPLPSGLTDGIHRLTTVVRDPAFPTQLASAAQGVVRIDNTSPTLGNPTGWVLSRGTNGSKFSLLLPDVDDAASGVAAVRVLANSDTGGATPPNGFRQVGTATPGASALSIPIDLAGMAEGRHATLVEAIDAAGNVTQVSGPALVTDGTPPSVTIDEIIVGTGLIRWTQRDSGGFGACATVVAIQGVGTHSAWRPVFEIPGRDVGAGGTTTLPLKGMAAGAYQARVTVCDSAGNSASVTKGFTIVADSVAATTGPSAGSGASSKNKDPNLEGARLVSVVVQREPGKRRTVPGREGFDHGEYVRVSGRLLQLDGRPLADVAIVLRDSGGVWSAGGRTAHDGSFSLSAMLGRGGKWTISAVGSPGLSKLLTIQVHAKLVSNLASRTLRQGEGLVVRGRLVPGPLAANKLLQLQWRDGRQWRPVANVTANASGNFEVRYRFHRGGGYSVPMRLVVPGERGWPFAAIIGAPVAIRVK